MIPIHQSDRRGEKLGDPFNIGVRDLPHGPKDRQVTDLAKGADSCEAPAMRGIQGAWLSALLVAGCIKREHHEATLRELSAAREAYALLDHERRGTQRTYDATIENLRTKQKATGEELSALQQELEQVRAQRDAHAIELAEALRDRSNLQSSIEKMKTALALAAARELAVQARVAEYLDLLARFKRLIDAGKLSVRVRDGRMVLDLPTDILFSSASARLSEEGTRALTEVGRILTEIRRRFQVEGHTDNLPIRTEQFPSNWELGAARALAVVRTLTAAGVPPEQVSAATYGEHHPAVANETAEQRQRNRRIEIVLLPDLSLLPGSDELERLGTSATGL